MIKILKAMESPITRMTIMENVPSFFLREIVSHRFFMYLNILSPPYPLNHGNVMCTAIVLPGRADGGMDAQTHPSLLSLSFLLSAWILYHKHGKSAKPAGLRSPCILWFFCSFICYLLSLGTLLWMPPAVSGLSLMWISVWALSFLLLSVLFLLFS